MSTKSSGARKGILGIFLLTVLLSGVFSLTGVFSSLDRLLYDLFLNIRIAWNPMPINPRIILVDINDSSRNEMEDAINSGRAFADLLSVLGDCDSAGAVDIIFKNPLPDGGGLVKSTANMRNLILAVMPVPEVLTDFAHNEMDGRSREILAKNVWHIKETGKGSIPPARSFIMSNPEIAGLASQLGHIGVEHDADGIYRKTPLFYRWDDGVIPSLALAAAVTELRIDPSMIEFHPGKAVILPVSRGNNPVRIPVDESGYVRIPYTSRWKDNRYRVPFSQVVKAKNDEVLFEKLFNELTGSITLVADTGAGTKDFGVTPIEAVYPLSGISQAVMSGILNNFFYDDLDAGSKLLLLIVFAAASLVLGMLKKDTPFHIGFLVLFLVYSFLTYALWQWAYTAPWFGIVFFFMAFYWLSGFVFRLFFRYRRRLLFTNALTRYFPRALAERIGAQGKTDVLPAYKELSVLFSNISGFTRWSANREPKTVHAFLSDYLESMTALIFEHGGTVDKFMGDGILAFFGDPVKQEDHAERAVRTAVAMQKKIAELRNAWMPSININLRVRIGINSGSVLVGNLGTKTRIEYTVIGSPVNLGKRMESNAPPGGILVTADTRQRAGAYFSFGNKKLVMVEGCDEPIECYEVIF
ncbi:MAG: adenylate/guanylate cyclase domain-containing protein [Treponema sp.]|jgi:adenylate cyclase|nr:adenylate/guanylate cyclase domain-containing protein [Treponema sp.]